MKAGYFDIINVDNDKIKSKSFRIKVYKYAFANGLFVNFYWKMITFYLIIVIYKQNGWLLGHIIHAG